MDGYRSGFLDKLQMIADHRLLNGAAHARPSRSHLAVYADVVLAAGFVTKHLATLAKESVLREGEGSLEKREKFMKKDILRHADISLDRGVFELALRGRKVLRFSDLDSLADFVVNAVGLLADWRSSYNYNE